MAELIKIRRPQKWLLKKRIEIIPRNRLISKKNYIMAHAEGAFLEKYMILVKNMVKDYCVTKDLYVKSGLSRRMRRYRTELTIELILLLIRWRSNIKKEAHALDRLAKKIASNITNCSKLNDEIPSCIDAIEKTLMGFFTLQIVLPKGILERINLSHKKFLEFVGQSLTFSTHIQVNGAQIWVNTCEMSFPLDFDEADISKILKCVDISLSKSG
jgi:hypothetical protein